MKKMKANIWLGTWQCHTCNASVNQKIGEDFWVWQDRIYEHWNAHPSPIAIYPENLDGKGEDGK